MNKKTERQFNAADAAVDRAVTALMSKIDKMSCQGGAVAGQYIIERALLALCDGMVKLIDDPSLADLLGPAELKLSNALADYRDSPFDERYSPNRDGVAA